MSMYLTFTIGKDKRNLVDDITDFHIDNSTSTNPQWLQARQNEDGMRQVFVTVKNEDGSPFNLTDCNYWFQGKLPDGIHKIIDARHGVTLDAQNGKFRFDMPKHAFTVAGSYVQAFFRIVRNGESLTTLEFDLTVLSDLVYNDLVPSDYITPFEDLYGKLQAYITKANGDFDAAMTQWKKDVADLITELNTDIGGINLTITEIKTQLASLEEKIKADGLLTQADFDAQIAIVNKNISDALAQLQSPVPVDDTIIVGKPVSAENKSALDNLKTSIDEDKFNMVFITDTHYAQQSELDNYAPGYAVDHLNHALYLDENVDVIVAGGDNIDGHNNSYPGILNDQKKFAIELLYGSNNHADKFALKGNHDDGSWRLYAYREGNLTYQNSTPETIPFAKFRADYQNADLLFEEHRNGDSNYFYKDYPDKKVRIVGLDSNDTPEDKLTSDGGLKYVGIDYMGYRQAQLDWIANTALQGVPEDYTTIIIGHCGAEPTSYDDDLSDPTHGHHTNQAQLNKIINNFIKGTSETVTNNVKDFEINVKTDFTAQGPRVMAGYIHGHDHAENYSTTVGFNSIGVINSFGPSWRYGDNDGWNLITLDTENHKLIFKGFGLATNRTITY
ncbi:BppU family phage baseplate upper protein [Pediococcus pentosaceus]|uniref:BppU family phage baseplate upper protein n=1 Tax=Pediococcus pentosaceus TaxID=1255 RepID=UPI0018FEF620|nr:BppU family phage baseplate upper protein [Pediococcus pentosaceus]MBF7112584.1 BppU family phage baseplate upper protein [Pediococcus pentosaceus]